MCVFVCSRVRMRVCEEVSGRGGGSKNDGLKSVYTYCFGMLCQVLLSTAEKLYIVYYSVFLLCPHCILSAFLQLTCY